MQDRISNHPNRWVLTPVTGETDTYDFTRADDPIQVGTPLNKATFLPDAVASALESATGISGIALPADALDAIATQLTTIGDASGIARCATGTYTGAGGNSTTKSKELTFPFKPRLVIVSKPGTSLFTTSAGLNLTWIHGSTDGVGGNDFTYNDGYTLSWVNTASSDQANRRMDTSGTTYIYFAVGVS